MSGNDNVKSSSHSSGKKTSGKKSSNHRNYDKRRPLDSGSPNGDSSTGRRPDYSSSYERRKARGDRPDYGSSYERAKARGRDRQSASNPDLGYDNGHTYGKNGKHKDRKGNKGHDGYQKGSKGNKQNNGGKNKGHDGYGNGKGSYDKGHKGNGKGHDGNSKGHDGYQKGHDGNNKGHNGKGGQKGHYKDKSYKHKTVNNYYGNGGYYGSYYPYSYSFGYNSFYDGLNFSVGYGSSYWDYWGSAWPYYGSYNRYRTNDDPYYNNTIVVIDDNEPEVVYVPTETVQQSYDLNVGWEHLATGRDENALKYFSTRVRKWGDSSSAKAGYALAAAQMSDGSRAVWSMRRAFRIDNGDLGYLPFDTRLRRLAELLESRYVYDAENSTGRDRRDALFMVAALRYILHEPEAALDAAYEGQDSGDQDSSLKSLIRNAELDLDY